MGSNLADPVDPPGPVHSANRADEQPALVEELEVAEEERDLRRTRQRDVAEEQRDVAEEQRDVAKEQRDTRGQAARAGGQAACGG